MCTLEKEGDLFILTLIGEDEHLLNQTLASSILSALFQVKCQSTSGSVLITTSQGKFFSNGSDLSAALALGSKSAAIQRVNQYVDSFKEVVAELISLPLPTVAAVSGHAAGAGFALALSHDYVLMRRDKGVLYLCELDNRFSLPDYITALMKAKIGSGLARRDVALRAMKIKGDEALTMGIVDSVHDSSESVNEAAMRLGAQLASRKWDADVYLEIRRNLYSELFGALGLSRKLVASPRL